MWFLRQFRFFLHWHFINCQLYIWHFFCFPFWIPRAMWCWLFFDIGSFERYWCCKWMIIFFTFKLRSGGIFWKSLEIAAGCLFSACPRRKMQVVSIYIVVRSILDCTLNTYTLVSNILYSMWAYLHIAKRSHKRPFQNSFVHREKAASSYSVHNFQQESMFWFYKKQQSIAMWKGIHLQNKGYPNIDYSVFFLQRM